LAKKGSGGTGGAHLASGYISLSVKYASAMGQIASDFDTIDKRAKSTGESITKNLVAGADKAKAQVQELGSAYEAQKSKVAALKAEVQQLQAVQERAAAAERAGADARRVYAEQQHANTQRSVTLQEQLNAAVAKVRDSMGGKKADGDAVAAAVKENAAVQAIYKQQAALEAKRKKDLQDVTRAEKEAGAARSASAGDGGKAQQTLNAELAKGKELQEQYSKAVQDATRKQELATVAERDAAAQMEKNRTLGQRIASAVAGPFAPQLQQAGSKAAIAFRNAFNRDMAPAKVESEHHARNIASGLLMGMTPQFLGAAGAGLAIGAAFKKGFSINEDVATAQVKLEALGHSQAEINTIIADSQKAVAGTSYEFADAMNASVVAMAAGVKPGQEMERHLKNVANISALTGDSYDSVSETLNRVNAYQVVQARDIRPLISKNIPVLQWLREYYIKQTGNQKISINDIREMITKKMISADVFEQVLSENLSGVAEKVGSKTVGGAMKNLWKNVGEVTAAMIQPVFGSIPSLLNKMSAGLGHFAEYIKPKMQAAVDWIKSVWAKAWPFISALWENQKKNWNILWQDAIKVFEWFHERWSKLWPQIKSYIDKFVAMWKEMWPQLMDHVNPFLAAWKRLWDQLYPIVSPIVKAIAAIVGWLAYEFIKHMPAITQFATNLIQWMGNALEWLRTKFWPWLKDSWKHFVEDVQGAIKTVKDFSQGIIDRFQMAKDGTTAIFKWFGDRIQDLKDGWTWIKEHNPFGDSGAGGVNLTSSSSPLVQGAPGPNVAMPAGLIDTEGKHSGPQARYVAGLVMQQFGIDHVGGARASGTAKNTHDTGTSIDIPIGPSAEERAKGDKINQWLQDNAKALGIYYTIWKDKGLNAVDNPSGGAGSTFDVSGHQNHIDVHFDGKTFAATGSNGQNYNIAPAASSHAMSGQDNQLAAALKARGFTDSQITGLIALNNVETGNWAHPESIMGFTNQQTGPGISAHVGGFKGMWDRRQSSGAVGAVGSDESGQDANGNVVDPNKFAAWLLKMEGYSATRDWQGNQYAPGQFLAPSAYSNKVAGAYGPAGPPVRSIPVALSDFSTPMQPGDPGYRPPGQSAPQTLPDVLRGNVSPVYPIPGTGTPSAPQTLTDVFPIDSFKPGNILQPPPGLDEAYQADFLARGAFGIAPPSYGDRTSFNAGPQRSMINQVPWALGVNGPTYNMPGSLDYGNMDSGLGHNAANQNLHRGIKGPLGTANDPVVTTDPKVADNTDPKNQPGAPDGPPLTPPDAGSSSAAPGAGSAAGQGLGGPAVGTDANGNPVDAQGNPAKDAATGLGNVASKAFSDQFAGTPFSDPTQWADVKSAGALLSFFGSMLQGNAGSGLGALFGPGKKGATDKQVREAGEKVTDTQTAVDEAQAKLDSMSGPQFTDAERAAQKAKVDKAIREHGDAVTDQSSLKGYTQSPIQNMLPGSPDASPGGPTGGGAVSPGGGWMGGGLPTGLVPQPNQNQTDMQWADGNSGGDTNINLTTNQEVTGDPVQANDMANRQQSTTLRSPLQTIKPLGS
jgi:hypothetical protein